MSEITLPPGTLLKMHTKLVDKMAFYTLPMPEKNIEMNTLLGKKIKIKWSGKIHCIDTGKAIKKTFGQGYSFPSFMKLASCDICYVKPELCHFNKGTCRQPKWGEDHCMRPHIVYLSITSGAKVGITRESNMPYRWIDQGAVRALPILKVKTRLDSGLIEVEIAKNIPDKTSWQKMLKGEYEEVDLFALREQVYNDLGDTLDSVAAEDLDLPQIEINYPILKLPKKMPSLDLEKEKIIEGELLGIKGQYLIFDTGVFNVRKFQGHQVEIETPHI